MTSIPAVALLLEICLYTELPALTMRVAIHNQSPWTYRVYTLSPFQSTIFEFGDGPLDGWVHGFHTWCYTGPVRRDQRQPRMAWGRLTAPNSRNTTTTLPARAGQYVGEQVAALLAGSGVALIAGFVGVADQFGQVYADGRAGHKSLALQTTADGVPLDPGEILWGEWAILYRADPQVGDPLRLYAEAVTRLTPGRVPTQPPSPGWSGWYQFFANVTAGDMRLNQAAVIQHQSKLPLRLIQLDDGYQRAWGNWLEPNSKFSEGVKAWAQGVRADDLEAGLWLSPFAVEKRASLFRDHSDAVLRGDSGRPLHGGFTGEKFLFGLDPTHPATQDHICRTIETVVHEWGIKYLKLDYLYCGALPGKRYDPRRTRAQALRDGIHLIRDTAGEDVTLLGCGCPSGPALGLVDIMRVSPDVAPQWYPRLFGVERPAPVRNDPTLPSARNAIRNTLHRHWTQGRWWWLDADNLLLRTQQRLTAAEVQSLATVCAMIGSHLILSDDLTTIDSERLHWASALLPVLPGDCLIPNLLTQTIPETLIRRMDGPTGHWTLVALFNWEDKPVNRRFTTAEVGLEMAGRWIVCDFWNHLARQVSESIDLTIPPHGVCLLAFRREQAGSQYVGSDLHFSMGAEVTSWRARDSKVSFRIDLGRALQGKLWIKLDNPPRGATLNGQEIDIRPTANTPIYEIILAADGESEIDLK